MQKKYIGIEESRNLDGITSKTVILGKATDRETLEHLIGDDINKIFQYGLGDAFGTQTEDQWICDNSKEEDIDIEDRHDPSINFLGDDITIWYGPKDSTAPQKGQPYRRFRIIEIPDNLADTSVQSILEWVYKDVSKD